MISMKWANLPRKLGAKTERGAARQRARIVELISQPQFGQQAVEQFLVEPTRASD